MSLLSLRVELSEALTKAGYGMKLRSASFIGFTVRVPLPLEQWQLLYFIVWKEMF